MTRFPVHLAAVQLALGLPFTPIARAQQQHAAPVTAAFDTSKWLAPRHAVELTVDSATRQRGRLAVVVGSTDLSSLFRAFGDTLRYQPSLRALPPGAHRLSVQVVSADGEWSEVASFPLRVLTTRGYEQGDVLPRLTVNLKGQLAEGHGAAADAPTRGEYQDLVISTGLQTVHRRAGLSLESQMNLLGASNRQEALRFRELESGAPKFDLADYKLSFARNDASVTVGEQSFGQQRQLMNAFASRGVGAAARLGTVGRVSFATANGSSVVGWANPVGLANADHRVVAGSISVDLVPRRPELVRLEGTTVTGTVQPRAGFNQGVITNAERSEGTGVRLSVRDPASRLQLDAGVSRSRSDVPDDSSLAQGLRLTGVERAARNARYADATYQLIRSAPLTKSISASLSVAGKHERVDPLYRSVASADRADVQTDAIDLQGTLGTALFRAGVLRMRDNLGHVASILTTRTRATSASVAAPLASFGKALAWLPVVSYDVTQTDQAGDGVPPNSEFAATHVPDQRSRNQNVSAEWRGVRWVAGYRLNVTNQDNRQLGRENADFSGSVHNATLAFTGATGGATLDLGFDGTEREESSERSRTRRAGTTLEWRMTSTTTMSGTLALTIVDRGDTTIQRLTDGRVEVAQRLPLMRLSARSSPGQLFVRFSHQDQAITDPLMAAVARRTWYVSTGLTLGVF